MTLQEWIGLELDIHRSMVVGREIRLAGEDAFILGVQTSYDERSSYMLEHDDEERHEITTKLVLLHECHEDSLDIDKDDDEYEELTIREHLMRDIEESQSHIPGICDISMFMISGKEYHVSGMSNVHLLEIGSHKVFWLLQEAFASRRIPKRWLEADLNDVWIAACDVEESIYEIDWNESDLDITVEMESETAQRYVGARFTIGCGELDEPYRIIISDHPCGEIEVQIHGISVVQADTFGECAALVIEYSASENLQMEFYRADYLDGSYSEDGRGIPGFLFSDDEENEHRFAFAGYVDKDFNDQVELELLSYGMASL